MLDLLLPIAVGVVTAILVVLVRYVWLRLTDYRSMPRRPRRGPRAARISVRDATAVPADPPVEGPAREPDAVPEAPPNAGAEPGSGFDDGRAYALTVRDAPATVMAEPGVAPPLDVSEDGPEAPEASEADSDFGASARAPAEAWDADFGASAPAPAEAWDADVGASAPAPGPPLSPTRFRRVWPVSVRRPERDPALSGVADSGGADSGAANSGAARSVAGGALVAIGLGIVLLSAFASTRLYGFVSPEPALALMLLAVVVVVVLAVRHDAEVIAALSLAAALVAPPLLRATANAATVAYIGGVVGGFAALSVARDWRWLPPITFVLAAPQVAAYLVDGATIYSGLAVLAVFWTLNTVSAGRSAFLRPRDGLTGATAALLVGNAAFALWAGLIVLRGAGSWRIAYVVVLAAVHLVLAGWVVWRSGFRRRRLSVDRADVLPPSVDPDS